MDNDPLPNDPSFKDVHSKPSPSILPTLWEYRVGIVEIVGKDEKDNWEENHHREYPKVKHSNQLLPDVGLLIFGSKEFLAYYPNLVLNYNKLNIMSRDPSKLNQPAFLLKKMV